MNAPQGSQGPPLTSISLKLKVSIFCNKFKYFYHANKGYMVVSGTQNSL